MFIWIVLRIWSLVWHDQTKTRKMSKHYYHWHNFQVDHPDIQDNSRVKNIFYLRQLMIFFIVSALLRKADGLLFLLDNQRFLDLRGWRFNIYWYLYSIMGSCRAVDTGFYYMFCNNGLKEVFCKSSGFSFELCAKLVRVLQK